jgi:hypothetical protein
MIPILPRLCCGMLVSFFMILCIMKKLTNILIFFSVPSVVKIS